MNAPSHIVAGGALRGRRVLSMLPISRKERSRYILDLLEAAKKRWELTIDGVCQITDREPYQPLVAPAGKLFSPPPFLQVADFERDPAQLAAVQERIRDAERTTGVPMGRHILASAHSIGRGFNVSLRFSNRYPLIERVTADNEEPFRIMRRLFVFAEQALDEAKPDIVLSTDWAIPLHAAFWMVGTSRGIPCITLRNSKLRSGRFFWSTDRLLWNTKAIDDAMARHQTGEPVSENSAKFIQEFRNRPKVVAYISARWVDRERRGFLRWHYDYVRATLREMSRKGQAQDLSLREPGFSRMYRYYRGRVMFYSQKRFLKSFDDEALRSMKYVYFPMHKEAEFAQTYQAAPWHDQRNTIRLLAGLLPAGYRLLVREHRMNYSVRPSRVYKHLAALPNVTLINPFDSQFKYIQNADLVVTENGSTGWEALVMGRRLITLSSTFYDGAGLGTKVWDPETLNEAMLAVLAQPAVADQSEHDLRLGRMLDSETDWSFPAGEAGLEEALDLLERTAAPGLLAADQPRAMARV
ncbi:MAG: hypothetical protein AB7V13_10685 [Pseudorhodoplanes sp.]|uniref:hypothetical protein n=1 Tax=Pseudorhodoplanes sp. TaxID=1934341 RepID=UPI003D141881